MRQTPCLTVLLIVCSLCLPNATYVGFTGTPIDNTLDVFGPMVDRYTITEAVADEITRKIVYEGRAAKVLLNSDKVKEIEKYYDECHEEGASEKNGWLRVQPYWVKP